MVPLCLRIERSSEECPGGLEAISEHTTTSNFKGGEGKCSNAGAVPPLQSGRADPPAEGENGEYVLSVMMQMNLAETLGDLRDQS